MCVRACVCVCVCVVGALVRAEKRRLNKQRIPPTPRNLSIHKDISSSDDFQPRTGNAIAVMNSDGTEMMMGECIISELQ